MKIAVVFDTPHEGWEDAEFRAEAAKEIEEAEYEVAEALEANGHEVELIGVHDDVHHPVERLRTFQPDLVFNCAEAFHDDTGLDYVIPALIEAERYPYTGAPPLALLMTRNKALSKKVLAFHGINVPGFMSYRVRDTVEKDPELRYPLIVKPNQTDASIGISQASIVRSLEQLAERVAFVHETHGQTAIAEEYVEGRELYVGMLAKGEKLEILPIVEMVFDKRRKRPEDRIATRLAKWHVPYRERKGIRNVFARPIAKAARKKIDDVCRTAFRYLWLRDYARLDIRLTSDDQVWVIEANANPFISYGHDMANAAEKAGMSYQQFIQRIVDEAMARHGREA